MSSQFKISNISGADWSRCNSPRCPCIMGNDSQSLRKEPAANYSASGSSSPAASARSRASCIAHPPLTPPPATPWT